LMPFFALIGLVTIISIIVNLQINRHSLFRKITGTVILLIACVFACLAILYPLYFGSFQNLIISFIVVFVLLTGIFAAVNLLINRRRFKHAVLAAADGPAEISDADKAKELTKPVQIRHMSPNGRKSRNSKSHKNEQYPVINSEKRLEQFFMSDPAEKEDKPDSPKPDKQHVFSDDLDNVESANASKGFGMHFDTAYSQAKDEQKTDDMGAELKASFVTAADQAADIPAEQEVNDEQPEDSVFAIEDASEPVMEQEIDDNYSEQYASRVDDDAEQQNDDMDIELTESKVIAVEETVYSAIEQEVDDIGDEQIIAVTEETEVLVTEQEDIDDELTDDDIVAEEKSDLQATQEDDTYDEKETGDIDEPDSYIAAAEGVNNREAEQEASNIDADQSDDSDIITAEEVTELPAEQADNMDDVLEAGDIIEENTNLQTEQEAGDTDYEQADDGIITEVIELPIEQEISDVTAEQPSDSINDTDDAGTDQADESGITISEEVPESQKSQKNDDMNVKNAENVVSIGQEDKYLRMIAKADELKGQGKYLVVIFMLQSCYQDIEDEAIKKQVDMLLLECFILSEQYEKAQKKWFDILSKKYDFKSDEKAKLKVMLAQLNSGRL